MKKIIQYLPLVVFCSLIAPAVAQEKQKQKMPLFVSHLSEENAALTRRKGSPRHYFLSRLICFNKKCRGFVGWRTEQRSRRYDYKTLTKKSRKALQKTDTAKTNVLQDKPINKLPPKIAAPAPQAPVLKLKADSIIILSEVLFEVNSYKLKQELLVTLDSVAAYLRQQPRADVNVSGHTDNTGRESYNLTLSSQRAEAVAEFLLDNGVNPERVSFAGLGSSVPIQPNDTSEGRRKNRRVEILIRWKN